MKTLAQLNKLNQEAVEAIRTSTSYQENMKRGKKYLKDVSVYRNALLKSMEGEELTIKGYAISEFRKNNFTIACAEVYYKGKLVDTLHHINVFADLLVDHKITGMQGEGNYKLRELKYSTRGCEEFNKAPIDALYIECEGVVYSYGNKYSVGTRRQVAYAKRKFAA